MKIAGLTIPPGLEEAFFRAVQLPVAGSETVLSGRTGRATRWRLPQQEMRSLVSQWAPIYRSLGTSCRAGWTAYWEMLPFGPHSGLGGWPGSGFAGFVYYNALRRRAGQDLKYCLPQPPSSWTYKAFPQIGLTNGIAWCPGIGLFVVVGVQGGTYYYFRSGDGGTWLSAALTGDPFGNGVAWSEDLGRACVVGVGSFGANVRTSENASTWTVRTTPYPLGLYDVCWGNGQFVAVGDRPFSGQYGCVTSSDGISWTMRTLPSGTQLRKVIWSQRLSLYIACDAASGTNRILTSPDGVTWTVRTTPSVAGLTGIADSETGGVLVALGQSGSGTVLLTSADGVTWTAQTSLSGIYLAKVIWSADHGLFFAAGSSGSTTYFAYSSDGISWTSVPPASNVGGNALAYAPELEKIFISGNGAGLLSN